MKVLIAFYSKTGRTKKVAEEIATAVKSDGHEAVLREIIPRQNLKASKYPKREKGVRLVEPPIELEGFDLVFVGTPVWNFCPTPIITTYLRALVIKKSKKFALFSTCTALPGTTTKRMTNILATRKGEVVGTINLNSFFEIDELVLKRARDFAIKTVSLINAP